MANAGRINELKSRIQSIELRLDQGISQVNNDGINATVSHSALERRLQQLRNELAECEAEDAGESDEQDGLRSVYIGW